MSDYSDNHPSAFDGLRLPQVLALLKVLHEATLATRQIVQHAFHDAAPNFAKTIDFMSGIGAVKNRSERLFVFGMPTLTGEADSDRKAVATAIIKLIVRDGNRYRTELFGYLRRFHIHESKPIYQPNPSERACSSEVRNFLMDLGLVTHDARTGEYKLAQDALPSFALALASTAPTLPAAFEAHQQAKEELGSATEEAVLVFEKGRVGPDLADEVELVSATNVAAGYDIRSVSVCSASLMFPRYIEVKAVPRDSFRFYWTSNEVGLAKALGDWYYLYLVPIGNNGVADIARLRMICDPCSAVLGTHSDWYIEENVLRCCLRNTTE